MISSGTNLVMTVIGFALSVMFIVFVCTRLICARIQLRVLRRSFAARASRSDLSSLERGLNGLEPLAVANFPTEKYREFRLSSKESSQCSVCLAEYHEEDMLRILPACGHSFHSTCIDIWLQQHSTCPVCRVSLRELPERKWFMQPMFSSAVRSQYCCNCMGNRPSRSREDQIMDPTQEMDRHRPEGDGVHIGNTDTVTIDHNGATKNSGDRKLESQSDQKDQRIMHTSYVSCIQVYSVYHMCHPEFLKLRGHLLGVSGAQNSCETYKQRNLLGAY